MLAYFASAVHPWIGPPAGIVLVVCWWLCPMSLIPDPVFLLCCRYQPSTQMHNLKWQSLSGSKCECMCTENINKNLHYSNSLIAACLTPYLFIHWYTCHLMAHFLYAKMLVLVTVFTYFSVGCLHSFSEYSQEVLHDSNHNPASAVIAFAFWKRLIFYSV